MFKMKSDNKFEKYYAKVLLPPIKKSGKKNRGKFGIIRVPMEWVGKSVVIKVKR